VDMGVIGCVCSIGWPIEVAGCRRLSYEDRIPRAVWSFQPSPQSPAAVTKLMGG